MKISLLSLCLFAQQAVSLSIAFFDTDGKFLKFYPYRTSSLSFLLMLLLLVSLYKEKKSSAKNEKPAVLIIMFTVLFAGLTFKFWVNGKDSYQLLRPSNGEISRLELYRWINENTPKNAVFIEPAPGKRGNLDFIRKTERDLFSVNKFVPTTNPLIYEWYLRTLENTAVSKTISYIHELRPRYQIDYLINKTPLSDPEFHLEFHSGSEYLYSIHSSHIPSHLE